MYMYMCMNTFKCTCALGDFHFYIGYMAKGVVVLTCSSMPHTKTVVHVHVHVRAYIHLHKLLLWYMYLSMPVCMQLRTYTIQPHACTCTCIMGIQMCNVQNTRIQYVKRVSV